MPTLPSATTRISNQASTAPVSTDLVAVIAPVPSNADGVPRLYSSLSALLDTHGYSEGAEYAALHMEEAGKPVLYVPLAIATQGAVRRTESVHTGTSAVTIAAGGSGALAETDGILKVTSGGTVGTSQILLSLSLDGGVTYQSVRLGTASSYVVPRVGLTISFGAGTLVAGDTILVWKTTGPVFDATGVELARTKMVAQQRGVRSWLWVGDISTLALAEAVETATNAYETASERYVYSKVQLRDRRILKSSQPRVAMVGNPAVTFAEVGATGDTITRATGSFVTDGFQVGDFIRVTGTASNNVSGLITAVTATVLTFGTTDLAPETIATARITAEPAFTFATPGNTITRNRGSWITEGFAIGDSVTVAGSASNDGVKTVTAVTATVLTVSESLVAEVAGAAVTTVSLTESVTDWKTSLEALVAPIDGSPRMDIGGGRLTRLSPITGYVMRRPVQWADSIRSYQHDVRTPTWWKELGPLGVWGISGEFDERSDGGLLSARITCARTWGNGPEGAFIAMSVTRATDGSILGMTHNVAVANVAQTVCQRVTEGFAGQILVLNPPDGTGKRTATKTSLADLEAKVNSELQLNLLSNVGGEGQRASAARWTAATDDNLGVADATLHGTLTLELNGTLVKMETTVGVR